MIEVFVQVITAVIIAWVNYRLGRVEKHMVAQKEFMESQKDI